MAENNSSAPLKTAEGNDLAIDIAEHTAEADAICRKLYNQYGHEQTAKNAREWIQIAKQLLDDAPQAVAAQAPAGNWINADDVDRLVRELDVALHGENDAAPQAGLCDVVGLVKEAARKLGRPVLAAPAAVAVPEITDAMVDAYLAEQRRTVEEADRLGRPNIGGLHTNTVRDACRNGLRAALAATPALPATEDSSAGDLAEVVPWDGKLSDQLQRAINDLHIECKPAVVRHLDFAIRSEITALHTSLATVKRMYAAARDRLEVIDTAQPDPFASNSQAEVQTEPVAKPPGIEALMCVISSLRDTGHISDEEGELTNDLRALRDWAQFQRTAPQAEPVAKVLGWVRKKNGEIGSHFFTYEPHCDCSVRDNGGEKIAVIAATAPQAQPADALDAKALLTHRAPWRDALVQMTTRGLTSDDAEQLYWRHELKAFDEAFAAMAAAQEGGDAAKEA